MTEMQKKQIIDLKRQGHTIDSIAAVVGESANTVKAFCYRNKKEIEEAALPTGHCQNCGAVIIQKPKRKPKKFCCVRCREFWWNSNRRHFNTNMRVAHCAYCNKEFEKFENSPQRFCSHQCYINNRFGEVKSGDSKAYLREHRPILFNQLLLSERLYPLCREIDEAAAHRMDTIPDREAAHEIILAELIYD